jgi:hypothetical protein
MRTIKCKFTEHDLTIYDAYDLEKAYPNFFPNEVFNRLSRFDSHYDPAEAHVRVVVKKLRHPYKDSCIGYLIMFVLGEGDVLVTDYFEYSFMSVRPIAVDLSGNKLRKIVIEVPNGV